jgi:hypothetical protein
LETPEWLSFARSNFLWTISIHGIERMQAWQWGPSGMFWSEPFVFLPWRFVRRWVRWPRRFRPWILCIQVSTMHS